MNAPLIMKYKYSEVLLDNKARIQILDFTTKNYEFSEIKSETLRKEVRLYKCRLKLLYYCFYSKN